jgi:hypothetical protein
MVNRDVARSVFAAVTDLHAGGGRVRPGRRVPGLLAQGEAALIQVMASKLPEVFQTATRLFGPGFRGLQVVFADASNRLPWERGCDAAMAFAQPMLGAVPRFAAH